MAATQQQDAMIASEVAHQPANLKRKLRGAAERKASPYEMNVKVLLVEHRLPYMAEALWYRANFVRFVDKSLNVARHTPRKQGNILPPTSALKRLEDEAINSAQLFEDVVFAYWLAPQAIHVVNKGELSEEERHSAHVGIARNTDSLATAVLRHLESESMNGFMAQHGAEMFARAFGVDKKHVLMDSILSRDDVVEQLEQPPSKKNRTHLWKRAYQEKSAPVLSSLILLMQEADRELSELATPHHYYILVYVRGRHKTDSPYLVNRLLTVVSSPLGHQALREHAAPNRLPPPTAPLSTTAPPTAAAAAASTRTRTRTGAFTNTTYDRGQFPF